jgi:hypothetical protein
MTMFPGPGEKRGADRGEACRDGNGGRQTYSRYFREGKADGHHGTLSRGRSDLHVATLIADPLGYAEEAEAGHLGKVGDLEANAAIGHPQHKMSILSFYVDHDMPGLGMFSHVDQKLPDGPEQKGYLGRVQ